MNARLALFFLSLCAGLYALLVLVNNLIDYDSNYQFVAHVLKMDSLFSGEANSWRSIQATGLYSWFYALIILTEGVIASACLWGSYAVIKAQRANSLQFAKAKRPIRMGLTLGILLWFGGFIVVGGEWFLMWQSETWNGIQSAFRVAVFYALVMVYMERVA